MSGKNVCQELGSCICERCGTIWSRRERQDLLDFKHRTLEAQLSRQGTMDAKSQGRLGGVEVVEVDHHEYDCGRACTPDGCPGHDTNIPVAFRFKGIWFEVGGHNEGDVPWDGPDGVTLEEYKEAFGQLVAQLQKR